MDPIIGRGLGMGRISVRGRSFRVRLRGADTSSWSPWSPVHTAISPPLAGPRPNSLRASAMASHGDGGIPKASQNHGIFNARNGPVTWMMGGSSHSRKPPSVEVASVVFVTGNRFSHIVFLSPQLRA